MSKYLLFSFSFPFMPFFLDFAGCNLFFFSFSARLLFLFFPFLPAFFLFELICFSSFFSFLFLGAFCRQLCFFFFIFLFLGAPHFVFLVLSFFFFSFFWWTCVFSLSLLPSPEQAAWNRSYALSSFPDRVDILVEPSRNHAMNDMLSSGTKYIYMYNSHIHEYEKCTWDVYIYT